ncbi:MAG: hypothetical protein ACE5IK_12975, partial [Acidobacteriota bacterium]
VSPSGAIGVSYFDFRFNDAAAGAHTDRWFISCHPEIASCDRFGTWQEARITDESFDIKAAPSAGGLFLGDYMGLAAAGDDFDVLFTQTGAGDRASAFHRRVRMSTDVAPRGLGWWRKQVRANLTDRGRPELPASRLLVAVQNIRDVQVGFDDVVDLGALDAVLDPDHPAAMAGRARAHVLALLLNLADRRVPPREPLRDGTTAIEAARALVDVVADGASAFAELEAAKDRAEAINEGDLFLN